MKAIVLSLMVLFGIGNSAFGQNQFYDQIDYTRVTCNFSGSVSKGNVLLVYGDGGIILRSNDGGTNWERINLSDSLNIIGMVALGSNFVGLCSSKYAILSSDGGKNWQLQNLGDNQFYQLLSKDNKLYALLNGKVWVMNQNLEKIKEYPLATSALYNSITLVGNSIVCSVGDGKLQIINTETDQQQTVVLSSIISGTDFQIKMPIKSNGSNLIFFAVGSNIYQYSTATSTATARLLLITKKGSVFESYNDDIYFLYTLNNTILVTLDSMYFVKSDINNKPVQIKQPGNDRYIIGLTFQSLTFISKDTIIAVGKNHLIYMSYNGGKNWELKSFMGQYLNVFLFNNQEARTVGPYASMSQTNNGGVTWLPQKSYPNVFTGNDRFYNPANYQGTTFFKDKMNGFTGVSLGSQRDTNLIFTNDGGRTVQLKSTDIIREDFQTFALEHSGKYILFTWGCIGHDFGCWTVVYTLNDTLGVEHKTAIRGWQMFYATNLNGTLYALGKDSVDTDTITYSVFISQDAGISWKKDFTFEVRLENRFELQARDISRIGNSLYIRWFSSVLHPDDTSARQNYYKINLDTKTARKILTIKADGGWEMFNIKNDFFVGTYTFPKGGVQTSMITTDDIEKDPVIWKPFTSKRFTMPNLAYFSSDSLFCFSTYDSSAQSGGLYFAHAKKTNAVIEEPIINNTSRMYMSGPQPQPARDIVRMRLYWDQTLDIERAEFTVFDLLGTLVSRKGDFVLNQQNSYSGDLVWRTSKLPSGIYFVRCRIGQTYCSSPVLIE